MASGSDQAIQNLNETDFGVSCTGTCRRVTCTHALHIASLPRLQAARHGVQHQSITARHILIMARILTACSVCDEAPRQTAL
jgi:hypothetical protein